jgi:hypothetical protein
MADTIETREIISGGGPLYLIIYHSNGGNTINTVPTAYEGYAFKVGEHLVGTEDGPPTRNDANEYGYTVTFNANQGTTNKTSERAIDIAKYTFKNWNSKENGTGTSYTHNYSQYTIGTSNVVFYAQWTRSIKA